MKRVRPERCASVIEAGIENVFAVCSCRAAIVNNERKDDRARSRFSVRNVFAPEPAPGSVATEAIAGAAAVAAAMSGTPGSLIGAMIGCRTTSLIASSPSFIRHFASPGKRQKCHRNESATLQYTSRKERDFVEQGSSRQ